VLENQRAAGLDRRINSGRKGTRGVRRVPLKPKFVQVLPARAGFPQEGLLEHAFKAIGAGALPRTRATLPREPQVRSAPPYMP